MADHRYSWTEAERRLLARIAAASDMATSHRAQLAKAATTTLQVHVEWLEREDVEHDDLSVLLAFTRPGDGDLHSN